MDNCKICNNSTSIDGSGALWCCKCFSFYSFDKKFIGINLSDDGAKFIKYTCPASINEVIISFVNLNLNQTKELCRIDRSIKDKMDDSEFYKFLKKLSENLEFL